MPPRKQPATLFDLALPITALRIRDNCDAILRNYGDVTQQPFQDRIESFNEQIRKQVPVHVLDRIRLHQNLGVFIYFKVKTLSVEEETLRDTPIHKHLTYNVCPRLDQVTHLDLSLVKCTLDLLQAVSANCPELQSIAIEDKRATWLLCLTKCKKLQVIRHRCFDYNVFDFGSLDLQRNVTIRMLQELPELREFKCDIIEILDMEELTSTAVYKLKKLEFNRRNQWISAENIKWLNIHCPFLNKFKFNHLSNNTILQALSLTDWDMISLKFIDFQFSDAMKLLFTAKGKLIETLKLDVSKEPLSYDNLVLISRSCPALRRLTLNGDWYDGKQLTQRQTSATGLFPSLQYFGILSGYDRPTSITTALLESLVNLRELEYCVEPHMALRFLGIVSGLMNSFSHLREITIYFCRQTPSATSTFVRHFVPVAMSWKNIRHIRVELMGCDLKPEATQYLEEIQSSIKEQNLDLILDVG